MATSANPVNAENARIARPLPDGAGTIGVKQLEFLDRCRFSGRRGALGNGLHAGALKFTVTCLDHLNNPVNVVCTQAFTFTSQPADGVCSATANAGDISGGTPTCEAPIYG